ncbi:hypothetical protein HON36_05905 [Candidatus Parcubacteria bacterium]|jgi:hypothetical protein|nr:hypothetical protein [Candidatus Parcubacteria bacterium]MBT7228314.1 hypothetical protein [Candidatus Parcubacteria bacterium]
MKFSKGKRVFLYFILFIGIGIFITWSTHEAGKYQTGQKEIKVDLVDAAEYTDQVRPWLQLVAVDGSLENIKIVRQNLIDLQGLEYSLVDTHMNIFLGFDAWENFLLTSDQTYKDQVEQRLSLASEAMPDLKEDLENLKKLLDV